jgi:hypothetical protein
MGQQELRRRMASSFNPSMAETNHCGSNSQVMPVMLSIAVLCAGF